MMHAAHLRYKLENKEKAASTGYLHPRYAEALSEYGKPVHLPNSEGYVLQRNVPGHAALDAMGCYPLFACRNWSALATDLQEKSSTWVSLSLVADPFGDYTVDDLRRCFPDVMFPFKEHFVVDLSEPPQSFVADHHSRNARKALQRVEVELELEPAQALDDWTELYDILIERHSIRGLAAFSRSSFALQLQVPGMRVLRARHEGTTVGMLLWYVMNDVAYYHLGAYREQGYELRASFALFATALVLFAEMGLKWLNLGAGAGAQGSIDDGLSRFKKGWSNTTRTAYFCGRIFDQARYHEIVAAQANALQSTYFPLYRHGEFRS